LISFSGVNSFKIGSNSYTGNAYDFDHSCDAAVYLSKGEHPIYIQYTHDVRRNGGSTPPKLNILGKISHVSSENGYIVAYPDDAILPELVDGVLASPFASVSIRNAFKPDPSLVLSIHMNDGPGWKKVLYLQAFGPNDEDVQINLK
jgi:hypothetical protein